MMTREEFDKQSDLCFSAQEHVYVCEEYINSLEQQNTALQARIKDLEEKDKIKNCEECYDKVSLVFKMRGIE